MDKRMTGQGGWARTALAAGVAAVALGGLAGAPGPATGPIGAGPVAPVAHTTADTTDTADTITTAEDTADPADHTDTTDPAGGADTTETGTTGTETGTTGAATTEGGTTGTEAGTEGTGAKTTEPAPAGEATTLNPQHATKPSAPGRFVVQRQDHRGALLLNWSDSDTETYYYLTASSVDGGVPQRLDSPAPKLGPGSTAFVVTGDLTAMVGGVQFRLQACNPAGCSDAVTAGTD